MSHQDQAGVLRIGDPEQYHRVREAAEALFVGYWEKHRNWRPPGDYRCPSTYEIALHAFIAGCAIAEDWGFSLGALPRALLRGTPGTPVQKAPKRRQQCKPSPSSRKRSRSKS